jgi:hypothetical protein
MIVLPHSIGNTINILRFSCQVPNIVVLPLTKCGVFRQIFVLFPVTNFTKIRPVGTALILADRQTDLKKLIVCFHYLCVGVRMENFGSKNKISLGKAGHMVGQKIQIWGFYYVNWNTCDRNMSFTCQHNTAVNLYLEVTPRLWVEWLIRVCFIVVISTESDIA